MKKILSILIPMFSLTVGFAQISSQKEIVHQNYIYEIISNIKKIDKVTDNPVIVINDTIIDKYALGTISISRFDIENLTILKKGQNQLIKYYGEESVNGVILIKTKPFDQKIKEDYERDLDVLYLVDGKKISNSKAKNISADSIANIQVINNKDSIIKYTSKEVRGIIKITLKNNP